MNKKEIEKEVNELEFKINSAMTKAIALSQEEIRELDKAYSLLEELKFKLRSYNGAE